jgi:transcriptional regulator with XRE-family HTH domain
MKVPGLRSRRERSGLTQRELAEVAGVARRSIAGWESGESIRPGSAGKLAEALGVTIPDLCEERISATVLLPDPSSDERTGQLLAMLRRYEEMARRQEKFDLGAADLTRLSGSIATESIYGAALAADRGDHRAVAEMLRRATTVLGWLQQLAADRAEREARARASITDPVMLALEAWVRGWPPPPGQPDDHPPWLARSHHRSRTERRESDG